MPPVYRGEIKVQGRTLRGWIANPGDPAERVPFDLVIDGEARGHYLADRPYQALERHTAFGDGAHGFMLQLDRDWISGSVQNVVLSVEGAASGVELHAVLGPESRSYFDDSAMPPDGPRQKSKEESLAHAELGECRRLRRSAPTESERAKHRDRYFEILDGLSRTDTRENGWRHSLLLGREWYDAGHFDKAIAVADRVLSSEADNSRALMTKGRGLVALNRSGEAHAIFTRVHAAEPKNSAAKFYERITRALASGTPGTEALSLGSVVLDDSGNMAGQGDFADRLAQLPFDWVRFTHDVKDYEHRTHAVTALNLPLRHQVGCVQLGDNGRQLTYWRRDALAGLAESGLIKRLEGEGGPARWAKAFVSTRDRRTLDAGNGKRKAVLVSPTRSPDSGDIDAFFVDMTAQYAAMGYDTAVVHADSAAELRKRVLEDSITLVHAVSGAGYTAADALAWTNIAFVYGVHAWRDVLGDAAGNHPLDDAGVPRPRPEFDYILSRASSIYAYSARMRDIVEQCFDVRCPIFPPPGGPA
jgi:tetratricopeptide (TPR) repeat protein